MPDHVMEAARKTPVVADAGVLVVGAGPAGIAAAIAAARNGIKTVLVEQHGCLGGTMTVGGVRNIRGFNSGNLQVIGGIAAELAERIRRAGGTQHGPLDGECVHHDPEITKFVAQEMVLEAGAEVFLHTYLAGAIVDRDALGGVIVENKSGRVAIRAAMTIDTTGDGDVIWHSGADYELAAGQLQPMTLTFLLGGVTCWPDVKSQALCRIIEQAIAAEQFPTNGSVGLFPTFREGFVYVRATRVPGDSTDARQLTQAEFEGRRQVMALTDWLRRHAPGYENTWLANTSATIGIRESRRLAGLYALTREDVLACRQFDDAIAQAAYPLDIHGSSHTQEMTPLPPGQCYSIPYRCLVPRTMDALLAAGRCLSATHDALGSARVMAIAMATGEAAGTAAAMAVSTGVQPRAIPAQDLRQQLRRQGAVVDPPKP